MRTNEEKLEKSTSFVKVNIPPIVQQQIMVMFDDTMNINMRKNYRDNIQAIQDVCAEAIKKFDRETMVSNKNYKPKIRAAWASDVI